MLCVLSNYPLLLRKGEPRGSAHSADLSDSRGAGQREPHPAQSAPPLTTEQQKRAAEAAPDCSALSGG
jgi:hypothetical protein